MQVVYGQIKQIKSENGFIKFDCCHKITNSWKLTQIMLMLKRKTWRSTIAIEEKCRQFNWCFAIYSNHQPRRNILLKVTLCKCIECWLMHALTTFPYQIYFCNQIYNTKSITHIQPKDNDLQNHKHIAGT